MQGKLRPMDATDSSTCPSHLPSVSPCLRPPPCKLHLMKEAGIYAPMLLVGTLHSLLVYPLRPRPLCAFSAW